MIWRCSGDALAVFWRVLAMFLDDLAVFWDVLQIQHSVQSGQGPHPHTGNLVVSTEDMFCGTFPDDQCT